MSSYQHATWTIYKHEVPGVDHALVGKTILLLTPEALEALPDNQEIISLLGGRDLKELAETETQAGFLAYGLLPDDWHRLLGSAVDKLGALSDG